MAKCKLVTGLAGPYHMGEDFHMEILKYAFIILLLLSFAPAHAAELRLSAKSVTQGGAISFALDGVGSAENVKATFRGGEVLVMDNGAGVSGIITADFETRPGNYRLRIETGGKVIRRFVRVTDGNFKVQRLTLPKKMVDLDEKTLDRVKTENETLAGVWKDSAARPLWSKPFIMPLKGEITSPFGNKRVLNGQPRGSHSGIDIAGPEGAPVKAANTGRVAFVGDFYFYGNFVVIDHGLGVFTMYFHLKDINVKAGEIVEVGGILGTVGMTGRATGPHLHYGVRVGYTRVSPKKFYRAAEKVIVVAER